MPELYDDRVIEWKVHVAKDTGIYDAVIGQDLLRELGITLNFKNNTVIWDDSTIHMRSQASRGDASYSIKKANLKQLTEQCLQLSNQEKSSLEEFLYKYEPLFEGTLEEW